MKFKYYFIFLLIILLLFFVQFSSNSKGKKPKISIFLPIYNKEKYIKKCFQSILNQTFKNLEIIAVNDRSTDGTLKQLIDFSKNDSRIKIITNDRNHGLLYSRAMGILNSYGEYIMNLDPDDELIGSDNLEFLYNQTITSNADIISYDVWNVRNNKIIKCGNGNKLQKQPNLFNSIFGKSNIINDYLIWNKLIKKDIFLKAYKYFKSEIYNGKWNYFEDDIWNILVNKYANSKLCLHKLIYKYNYNKDSLMQNRFNIIEFQNILYRHEMYKKIFSSKQDEKYLRAEYIFLFNRLNGGIKHLLLINDNTLKKYIISIFNNFLNNYICSNRKKEEIKNFLNILSS